jgi:hypothetical protein
VSDLDPIEQLRATVRDIERTVRRFSMSGPGVSGHINDGYIVNARPGAGQSGEGTGGGGVPPPIDTCPSGNITAVFSGISVDCGCVDAHPFGASEFDQVAEIGAGVNDTFVVPFSFDFNPPKFYDFVTPDNRIHYSIWFDPIGGCIGPPSDEVDNQLEIMILCYPDTGFTILSRVGSASLFYAQGITDISSPIPNELTCGLVVDDPLLGHYLGFSHDGTVELSI